MQKHPQSCSWVSTPHDTQAVHKRLGVRTSPRSKPIAQHPARSAARKLVMSKQVIEWHVAGELAPDRLARSEGCPATSLLQTGPPLQEAEEAILAPQPRQPQPAPAPRGGPGRTEVPHCHSLGSGAPRKLQSLNTLQP